MSTTTVDLTPKEAELVRFSDEELVSLVYELVNRVHDDDLSDEMHHCFQEAFERFAPSAEWAHHLHYYRSEYRGKDRDAEIAGTRASAVRQDA